MQRINRVERQTHQRKREAQMQPKRELLDAVSNKRSKQKHLEREEHHSEHMSPRRKPRSNKHRRNNRSVNRYTARQTRTLQRSGGSDRGPGVIVQEEMEQEEGHSHGPDRIGAYRSRQRLVDRS